MKKFIILVLFSICVFLIQPNNAKAFTGEYNYDVNSMSIVGNDLVITGWAVANPNGNEANNIQPTYKLEFVNNAGTVVLTAADSSEKPSYQCSDYNCNSVTAKDFNHSYYQQFPGFKSYQTYGTKYERAVAVRDSGNFMYINNHFTFNVPMEGTGGLHNLLIAHNELRMNLIITVPEAGNREVYNVSFNQPAFAVKINSINAQAKSIDNSVQASKILEVLDYVDKVTVIVNQAYVQGSKTLGSTRYHCYTGWYTGAQRSPSAHYTHGEDFNVKERIVVYNKIADYNINTYQVGLNISNCLGVTGSNLIGYIPATWSKPFTGGGLKLKVKIDTCKDTPACTSLSADCPKTCCTQLCSVTANKNSEFCVTQCTEPEKGVCEDISDPLKQYCCYHPQDKEMCSSGGGEYPKGDPENKPGTCTATGETKVEFKYPASGWHKAMISNDACKIGCQEKLVATFQPTQPVRAGMGFEYPVKVDSSRYCVADYDNEGWQTKINTAAVAANNAYDLMISHVDKAAALDAACGTKLTLTSEPTCASSCGSRSGSRCLDCTCSGRSCSRCGDHEVSCATVTNPTCTRTVCDSCSWSCTKSVSCPSGYSYRSSIDACARDVCSRNTSKLWSTAQAEIGSELSAASSARTVYNTNKATVDRLNGERATCDNYVANNSYRGASNARISTSNVPSQTAYIITSSRFTEDTAYENARINVWKNYSIYECKSFRYTAPHLVGDRSASGFSSTYCDYVTAIKSYRDFWNKKSDASLTFEFSKEYYVQRYTGALRDYASSGYDYDGRFAYTDFYDPTAVHNFSLIAVNIGPNLVGVSNNLWSINPFTCNYSVTNLIFPPGGDPQHDLYGNVAFMYRQISLTDPFPNRSPGENWKNKESLITGNGYSIYGNTPLYAIKLNPSIMQGIRSYGTNYGSFYVNNPYRSIMVENYIRNGVIIKRGR